MSTVRDRWILAAFAALAGLGFLVPFWPLSLIGVVFMALWGRWFMALILGLLLDLAWGAPVGLLHFLYFPFTAAAVVAALVHLAGARYFINRAPPSHL